MSGVYASVLTVQGHIFAKFGHGAAAAAADERGPSVRCYTLDGDMKWEFRYEGISAYETSTPLIAGDHIYVPAALGHIYRIPWKEVSGIVTAATSGVKDIAVPVTDNSLGAGTGNGLDGMKYSTGPGSLVFDSGCIFFACSNGMIYCMDTELDLVWAAQMKGSSYFMSPTVFDGYVAAGALNGSLYVMSKTDGRVIGTDTVYTEPFSQSISDIRGSVASPVALRTNFGYRIIFSVSSGRGMDSLVGGIGMYDFDGTALSNKYLNTADFGLVSNYLQPVAGSVFDGVYFTSTKGLFRISAAGEHELLNDSISRIKAPLTLVNGDRLFIVSYEPRKPVYLAGLDGTVLSIHIPQTSVVNYGMSPVVIAGGMVIYGNDSGLIVMSGTFPEYVPAESAHPPWYSSPAGVLISILLSAILILAVMYAVMRLKGIRRPFAHIRGRISHYLGGEDLRHNTKNRHRLLVMMTTGAIITSVTFIACLCIGPTVKMSVGEMFSAMFSAIAKGGAGLSYNELMVYESRLPRTLMALLVGIGLSVAGCIYQAIIRNPLVDPYIMGVSAGAGTAAVSVIAFNFTLFGLFSPHSIYLTAVCAMIGGIAAFFATMLIAEKAGGTSVNYVLAGIVIGLALSSLQTLMLSMAGQHAVNALSWLFGSFANVSWDHVRLVVFPLIALSLVPLFWAREFNLVLLGEDQARQMGLNVRRFSRSMLIIASVLTALCVAFVGIIGFVGLVIPHLCRMILGGDHRLVIPASIAVGGALMMFADLIARTAYFGHELPVGAITTMIGVPVFAYLLIKRGKLYEG
jgi:iron complex transport system permease protein